MFYFDKCQLLFNRLLFIGYYLTGYYLTGYYLWSPLHGILSNVSLTFISHRGRNYSFRGGRLVLKHKIQTKTLKFSAMI